VSASTSRILTRLTIIVGCAVVFSLASGFGACSGYSAPGALYGPVVVTPTGLSLNIAGPTSAPFTASQANYYGSFAAVSNNTTLVTVGPTTPPNTFLVSGVVNALGMTTITVTGGAGLTATVNVDWIGQFCARHRDMWSGR
jgi:hypothetical protein